jgi:ATPase subunit of ABC transporter with duplicated ATPase domains
MISQEIVVTVGGGVFVESKLVIAKGLKYALIGRNGVGKSSLLKFIVQTSKNDGGVVRTRTNRVGFISDRNGDEF